MVAKALFAESATETLEKRGRMIVRVFGKSMHPSLKNGMKVEVQRVEFEEIKKGDLIVVNNGGGIICHRLLRKEGRLCFLKGDANLYADPPALRSQVIGRVVRSFDDNLRITPLDTPKMRKRGALIARFSYLYALYFNLKRLPIKWGRSRGIVWAEDDL